MDPKTILENFDTIAESQGGIERLRRLILDLAVQGRLVPNIEEDASHLLVEARNKVQDLIDRGTANQPRAFSRAPLDGMNLPANWIATSLGDACLVVMGNSPPGHSYNDTGAGSPLVNGPVEFSAAPLGPTKMTKYTTKPTRMCLSGDLLVCVRGATTGRTNIATFAACIGRGVALVRAWRSQPFINLVMWRVGEQLLAMGRGTTFPSISYDDLAGLAIGLPPISEQERIVAKVDELMRLCDDLEALQQVRQRAQGHVRSSSFHALTVAETNTDLDTAWSRIHTNWAAFTDHLDGVDDLQQMTLQLAIRGRLVKQRPDEGSAKVLLEAVAAERSGLVTDGLVKKPKPLPEPSNAFVLPPGWRWARLGSLCIELSYGTAKKCHPAPAPGVPVLRIPNIRPETGKLSLGDLKFTELSDSETAKYALSKGDLLIIRSNGSARLVGRAIVVPESGSGLAYAGYLMRARLIGVSPHYVRLVLESPWIRSQIEGPIRTTSGVKNVNSKEVLSLEIPVPPLAEQHRIVERIEQLDQDCRDLATSLYALESAQRELAAGLARSS